MHVHKLIPLITTSRLPELAAFYRERFGFTLTFESERYLGLKAPGKDGCEIAFMQPEDAQPQFGGAGVTVCMEVDDVDAEHERARARQVEIVEPPRDNPWGDRSFIARDPIGVMLYVYKPIPAAPEFALYARG